MKENSKSVFRDLMAKITLNESEDEIRSIALILLENLMGITNTDIVAGKAVTVTPEHFQLLANLVDRINNGEPVQYVVGEAFFYGRKFLVNPSVLIPRPETEEVVRTVLSWMKSARRLSLSVPEILDIGTGSGCIAITLSLELKHARIFAMDVSVDALAVARKNAQIHGAGVSFINRDILKGPLELSGLDVIVSNPPYVTLAEKADMRRNVRDFEPHLALFVPDEDPLLFYRAIVERAATSLTTNGLLVLEINERYGPAVSALLDRSGFKQVQIIKDFAGKDRVVRGLKEGTL